MCYLSRPLKKSIWVKAYIAFTHSTDNVEAYPWEQDQPEMTSYIRENRDITLESDYIVVYFTDLFEEFSHISSDTTVHLFKVMVCAP